MGAVDPTRDLVAEFQAAGFYYASDRAAMDAAPVGTRRMLGLFNTGNMDVALDKIAARRGGPAVGTVAAFPNQPMLEEMTVRSLEILKKERAGFVLMVEAASIDKQAHNMDTERWILETIEFDRTVRACLDFQKRNPDTLVIVTADHECAGVNIIGGTVVTDADLRARSMAGGPDGVVGTRDGAGTLRSGVVGIYEAAGFPVYGLNATDGYPTTLDSDRKMLIGYAGSGDRFEDWLTNPVPNATPSTRDTAGDFFIAGQAGGSGAFSAVHTGSDIPLSASGRGANLFHGVMDNTEVFFRVMRAAYGCD